MNLIYVHVKKQNNKGPFTLQGQNLVNEDKFSFCAPRPGFVLLLVETEFELERKIHSRAAITEIRFVDCAYPMPIRCLSDQKKSLASFQIALDIWHVRNCKKSYKRSDIYVL